MKCLWRERTETCYNLIHFNNIYRGARCAKNYENIELKETGNWKNIHLVKQLWENVLAKKGIQSIMSKCLVRIKCWVSELSSTHLSVQIPARVKRLCWSIVHESIADGSSCSSSPALRPATVAATVWTQGWHTNTHNNLLARHKEGQPPIRKIGSHKGPSYWTVNDRHGQILSLGMLSMLVTERDH